MSSLLKKVLIMAGIALVAGVSYFLYVWYMPARDVSTEKPIIVTAQQIFKDYNTNEKEANVKYLDKAVQVSGEIMETKTDQEGKTVCLLKTEDPFFGVNCKLKKNATLQVGQRITLKGICTGYLTGADVVVIDCAPVE